MSGKSGFKLLFFIPLLFALYSCAPSPTPLQTDVQDAVATVVAATLDASHSATQTAVYEVVSPQPTSPPTQSETSVTVFPTSILPTPTETPSPSLARVAYLKGGNVYLWTEGVGSIGLTTTGDAVDLELSGDGERIAYVRQEPDDPFSQELWVVDTRKPFNPRVLVTNSELSALIPTDAPSYVGGIGILDLAWRHGTHELAYGTLILHEGPGFSPNHDLRLVEADSMVKTTLLEKGEGGIFYYSPDGSQIALSKPESISLINADGTNLRRDVLVYPSVTTYSEYQYHPHPIWAGDSTSLRVAIPPEDPMGDPLPATGLWHIPVDGSSPILLGNIKAMPFAWPDNAFAPDLQHVIYAMPSGDPAENVRDLRIANPDGSNDEAYDRNEALQFLSWSPDSVHFIYAIYQGERQGLYLGSLGGETAVIHPDPGTIKDIRWLDGTRYAYLSGSGDQWELRLTNLDGDDLAFIDTIPEGNPTMDVTP